jgi:glycosyltransferase involved in cell wall biosynthesis
VNVQPEQPDCLEVSDPDVLVRAPLVSVKMITYNHEPYLAEAIEGVIGQQTQYPYELVVGEDYSKDKTREIALSYQRRYPDRIRVLYSASNVGWHQNSERVGLRCRGKYIAFCEGDDYWHDPLKLQKQVSFIENNTDYVMVHSALRMQVGAVIKPYPRPEPSIPTGKIFENLIERNFVATCTVCMRGSVAAGYCASQFSRNGYLMGDYPLWLFTSQQGLAGYINEPLATYRVTPGSMMRRAADAELRMEMSARQVRRDFAERYGCSAEALASALRNSNRRVLHMAANLAERTTFLEEYQWYRMNNPGWRKDAKMLVHFLFFKLRLFRAARSCWRLAERMPFLRGQ